MVGGIAFRGNFDIKAGKIQAVDHIVNNHTQIILFDKIHQVGRKQETLVLTIRPQVFGFRKFQNELLKGVNLGVFITNITNNFNWII